MDTRLELNGYRDLPKYGLLSSASAKVTLKANPTTSRLQDRAVASINVISFYTFVKVFCSLRTLSKLSVPYTYDVAV